MKKYLLIGLVLVSCVLVISMVGCGTSGSDVTTTTTSITTTTTSTSTSTTTTTTTISGDAGYFPNTDGYGWTYTVSNTGQSDITLTWLFDGTEEVSGVTTQILKQYNGTTTSESNFYVTSSSVKVYNASSLPTTESTWLVFPFAIGDSWMFYSNLAISVEAYQSITVPAGTYECFYLRAPLGEYSYNFWYADGVGMVKCQFFGVNTSSTQELVSKNF